MIIKMKIKKKKPILSRIPPTQPLLLVSPWKWSLWISTYGGKCFLHCIINRKKKQIKMIILAPTLETLLGINEGMRRERMGKKGRKREKTQAWNFPAREIYFSFKIKNTNQFHWDSKIRNEWEIWLVMFRSKRFLEIDCNLKNERFCFFKNKKE